MDANSEEDFLNITPEEFEKHVKIWLEDASQSIKEFEVLHRSHLKGSGGEYEIDILVELEIFGGALVKILIECKRHKNPIKRDIVMILESKLRDIGAHKGIIFSTSDFQDGAIKYATARGIAVIKIDGDEKKYFSKAKDAPKHIRKGFIGWFLKEDSSMELVDETYTEPLKLWLQNNSG